MKQGSGINTSVVIDDETHTHTHPFNGPLSRTTRMSRYQKDKTNLDSTHEARDSEWQWHQLGHMQVCTLLQTDNMPVPDHSMYCMYTLLTIVMFVDWCLTDSHNVSLCPKVCCWLYGVRLGYVVGLVCGFKVFTL